jgi:shikimate kinase
MKVLRKLSYWLFRTSWNKHLRESPEVSIPISEDLRVSAIRALGVPGYEACKGNWVKMKFQSRVSSSPILIAGLPKHGKSYVAELLSMMLKEKWCNTSDLIKEKCEGCQFEDKESVRKLFIETGDRMCKDDPGAIIKELLSRGFKIIAGLRKPEELKSISHLNPFVIWVDRPGHPTVEDNTQIGPEYADLILVNNQNLESTLQSLVYSEEEEELGD